MNKKLFDRLTSTFNYDKTTGILYGTHHGYLTSIDAKEITVIETSSSDDGHCIIIRSGLNGNEDYFNRLYTEDLGCSEDEYIHTLSHIVPYLWNLIKDVKTPPSYIMDNVNYW